MPRGRRGRPPAPRPEGGAIGESSRLDGGRSRGFSICGRPGERRRGDLPAPGLPRRRCGNAALAPSARRARDRRGARDSPPRAADARHAPRQGRGRAHPVPRGSPAAAAAAAAPAGTAPRVAVVQDSLPTLRSTRPGPSPRPGTPAASPVASPSPERRTRGPGASARAGARRAWREDPVPGRRVISRRAGSGSSPR